VKVSDYVADFLADIGGHVYGVCGAGAMHLNDSICNHPRIKFIAMHHEQAAAMAAEAESRITNRPGLVHCTAGPGGTNTITGVAGAWVDSIPMIVIAGQVGTGALKKHGLRQLGTNELGLVEMVGSITKYAVTVLDPLMIRFHMERALHLAMDGKRGPVWIEIPLDVQCAEIEPEKLPQYDKPPIQNINLANVAAQVAGLIGKAKRPLIIVGNGIHLAGAEGELRRFVEAWQIPTVSSWNGSDLFDTRETLYVGRPGIMGDRAGNFAVQTADLILAIGTRLSIPQIGHDASKWAPNAVKVMVDVSHLETEKLKIDVPVVADAKLFLQAMLKEKVQGDPVDLLNWQTRCLGWKERYPVMRDEYRGEDGYNSYDIIDQLPTWLSDDSIIVTDVGAAFISAMQSLKLNGKQRLFHSGGVSAMGWGIPAAIGACLASGKQTICLVGDGGAMMNIQELQTIVHHKLPITIYVFENGGYLTMQYTQGTHFKREAASSPASGVSCPDFIKIADAFEFSGLGVVNMPRGQKLMPRVQSRMEDGKFVPVSLEDMWPHLPADELKSNMAA
jgi:acetolactate synthase-1/2/3 large subunit